MKKIMKLYSVTALLLGLMYMFKFQNPNFFVLLLGIGLFLKSIISLVENDKGESYQNLGFALVLVIFGIGLIAWNYTENDINLIDFLNLTLLGLN